MDTTPLPEPVALGFYDGFSKKLNRIDNGSKNPDVLIEQAVDGIARNVTRRQEIVINGTKYNYTNIDSLPLSTKQVILRICSVILCTTGILAYVGVLLWKYCVAEQDGKIHQQNVAASQQKVREVRLHLEKSGLSKRDLFIALDFMSNLPHSYYADANATQYGFSEPSQLPSGQITALRTAVQNPKQILHVETDGIHTKVFTNSFKVHFVSGKYPQNYPSPCTVLNEKDVFVQLDLIQGKQFLTLNQAPKTASAESI